MRWWRSLRGFMSTTPPHSSPYVATQLVASTVKTEHHLLLLTGVESRMMPKSMHRMPTHAQTASPQLLAPMMSRNGCRWSLETLKRKRKTSWKVSLCPISIQRKKATDDALLRATVAAPGATATVPAAAIDFGGGDARPIHSTVGRRCFRRRFMEGGGAQAEGKGGAEGPMSFDEIRSGHVGGQLGLQSGTSRGL
ncbi:hypothetical protein ZWY2020_059378 [Hordeum vulgare]|nr:hypothetical protein ZWY2020_059378 [Hordeum vulgare]